MCADVSSVIRMGFIGGGHALRAIHLPIFSQMEDVLPLVVCDVQQAALLAALRQFGVRETTANWHDVLAMPEIDAVVIALPNDLHAPVAEQALRAGKHVLCEPPSGINVAQAEAIARAARESNRVYALALPRRHDPAVMHLERLIESDIMGRITHVQATVAKREGRPEGWRTDRRRSGGGALLHFGTHLLDLSLRFMRGAAIERVSAVTRSRPSDPADACVEDAATVLIRFAGGRSALIETAWAQHLESDCEHIEVIGERGRATLWPLRLVLEIEGARSVLQPQLDASAAHARLARAFIDRVRRHGHSPARDADDGLRLAGVLAHAYESAMLEREIEVGSTHETAETKGDPT
ncbi:MAG: gfo/Idh/MocA family oxidoreductase [Proteobacteria bacterium]|nr:gfo/Idh/MocA family oxidoreductase [Pseudomonadota bacterium]